MTRTTRRRRCRLSFEPLESRAVPALLLVTTLRDDSPSGDGLVSLREAIDAANTDATTDLGQTGSGADEITFDPALFAGSPGTITLGGTELAVTGPLTITGPGAATLSISGNHLSGIFSVDDGTASVIGVTVTGMTLTAASTSGAVVNAENLTLTGCTLSGNSATNAGGAILDNAGTVTLTDCTLANNTAGSYGGAIFINPVGTLRGTVTLTNCTVSGNSAPTGGGIYNSGGTLTMTGCTVAGNSATSGGGISNSGGTLTLTGCTVSGNSATSGAGGGIVTADGGRVSTLTNCTVSGNAAATGGGIYSRGRLTLTDCTVAGNSATSGDGGGIANHQSTVTLSNCTVSGNTATGSGGGITNENEGAVTLTGCTVSGNSAPSGEGGGGIFNYLGTVTLTNCTLSGNSAAADGGGVYNYVDGDATLTNCTLSGNSAADGGGILNKGALTLNNTIVANSVGAADVTGYGTLRGSNNLVEDGSGGLADTITGDPLLGPLADNGGPTLTHALMPGSRAINAGDNALIPAGVTTDQRGAGFARVAGRAVDIGAVENQTVVPLGPTPELVVSGMNGTASVFVPDAAGQYGATATATMSPFPGFGGAVRTATADVDMDGVPDTVLVTGPGTAIRVAVVSGADNSTVLVQPFDPFGGDFTGGGFVAAADLDADGRAEFVVTPDQGGGPRVTIFALVGGAAQVRANFFGIDDPNFRGGARAAVGDVNGDGSPDLAVAAGFLGGPRTAIFDGTTLFGTPTRLVNDFFAFPGSDAITLRNGVFVAAGDVNGDGRADLIFGGGPGGAPRVFILSGAMVAAGDVAGAQAAPVANFFVAGNATDRGGVRLAVKDADGDGKADVVAGSGEGSHSNVRVYLGKNFTSAAEPGTFQDLDPYGAVMPGGVFVG